MPSGYEKSDDYGGPAPHRRTIDVVSLIIAVALAAVIVSVLRAHADPVSPSRITVTDGDTIRVDEQPVRLVGFNAPEVGEARCEAELALAVLATRRLEELVAAGGLSYEPVRCSCRPGTEGTRSCNYGRACGTLRSHGRDVGDILVAEGLAVPFVCGETRCPRTPRPWCA